jgi:flagellar basal-body rod protein FlgF
MEPVELILQSIQSNVRQVDVLSHNIANANTPGYQPQQVFSQYMGEAGLVLTEATSHAVKGGVKETGRPLDVAILNDGFLIVEQNGQQALTRNGRLHVDAQGTLKHASGAQVIGQNGFITLPSENIRIDELGNIYANDEIVETLLVMSPTKSTELTPIGGGLYSSQGELIVSEIQIKQHSINGASVSTSHDMVRLIEISRHTQSLQKAVLAMDQISNAGINELGRK